MKKNHLWALAAVLICGLMTFSACTVDEVDNPAVEPEPVFLTQINNKIFNPGTDHVMADVTEDLIWEDGLLKQVHSESIFEIGTLKTKTISDEYYTYDGKGRCIEEKAVSGSRETIYTFFYDENGRLAGGVEKSETAEISITVTSYTDDGLFQQLDYLAKYVSGNTYKRHYDLTWKNGNIVKYIFSKPDEEEMTAEVVYDNYPSPYTGFPLVIALFQEPYVMCTNATKNNPLWTDVEYTYANGRVIQKKSKDKVINYVYSDGTGK